MNKDKEEAALVRQRQEFQVCMARVMGIGAWVYGVYGVYGCIGVWVDGCISEVSTPP